MLQILATPGIHLPYGFLKFNVDAAFKDSSQVAGIAIICRNDEGELIDGLSCRKPCSSALVGETYALLEATNLANSMNDQNVIFETDSELLLKAVTNPSSVFWEISSCVQSIALGLHNLPSSSLEWVGRLANQPADWIAKSCLSGTLPLNFVVNPPSALCPLFGC
ncbi:hypothetical protein JCGZ_18787 [Jatropha curcas]|uniref:RNase H type-1 domain-containing protein n=1 Tax=Jatropha curcas TaxID=180498 RepID=A0A067KBJ3_JATCU|nr:hypothetical protein JCGZ_18787 [Jatropha curcas]